jgi:hypothetical protein
VKTTYTNNGNLVAIIASGDITDFGYNYIVNAGRITMERSLNISGSYFASNIVDQASCLSLIAELVPQGYKLIISTTTAHVNCPIIAASLYPDVNFVMSGGTSTKPNLSSLNFSGPDQYFALGVFCGAMSQTNKVGFVHPGPPLASIGTLNAFYVGVKTANPDCSVFSAFTDSYLNPDRTTGAAHILLGQGVDMLAGQQDDMTLQQIAMANGFLAIGTNGFSLRNIFGEMVGVSVIRNWGGPFTTYAANGLSGTYRNDVNGAFASGFTYLDTPSHLVPDDVWQTTQTLGVNQLKGKTKPYYCSPFVSSMGLNDTTGCLRNNTVFTSQRLADINHMGTYHVPVEKVPFPEGTRIAITILASILYLVACAIGFGLIWLRRDAVMLASSPIFLGLVLIGVALVFSSAIVWVSPPTPNLCAVRIWLPSVGFTLSMGALIIKNVRLMIIFDAVLKRVKIQNAKLLVYISLLMIVDVVLLGLWQGLGDPHVDVQQAVEGLGTYQVREVCSTTHLGNKFLYAIISWHVAQLAIGCFVTFKIRVIDIEEFNESRPFGLCIYVVSLVFTIAGILIGTGGTTNVQMVTIVSLSLLAGTCAILFLLFAPKFLSIFAKGSRPLEAFLNTAMSRRKTTGSGKGSSGEKASSGGTSTTEDTRGTSTSTPTQTREKPVDVVVV